MNRLVLGIIAFAFSVAITNGQDPNTFYILIDSQNLYPCRTANPLIQIANQDVQIQDDRGNKANYIKAPGTYTVRFSRISVQRPLPNLSGEISITIQVPLFEGPGGLRFDVPYQAVPQQNLLNSQCDAQSGIVQKDGKPYCRYCNMCMTTAEIEAKLNQNHKYLPELNSGEEAFSRICTQLDDQSYEITRTINLPSRQELEQMYKQKSPGLEGQLKSKLDKGRGRFQVFLNLLTSNQPPLTQDDFYMRTQGCRCCSPRATDLSCKLLSAINCNRERCKSQYGAQCLQGGTQTATCYTAEFNYRVTDKLSDVQAFLREHNYPDTTGAGGPTGGPGPSRGGPAPNRGGPAGGQRAGSAKDRCLAALASNANLRRYCTNFWSESFCCPRCPNSC